MEALGQGVDTCKRQPLSRQHTMKIIVSIDARGWIVARNAQGDMLEECFFKTDDETDEEPRAWGYRRLSRVSATVIAGEGSSQHFEELFLRRAWHQDMHTTQHRNDPESPRKAPHGEQG